MILTQWPLTGIDTISIVGVHNEDQTLGVLVIVSPQRSNFILSTNIPHSEANIFVFHSLHVKSYKITCYSHTPKTRQSTYQL
jgi:competence transcription factor ComK